MGVCKFTMRSVVGLFGVAFLVVSVALFILSVGVIVSYGHYNVALFKHYYTLVPAVALMIVGVFFGLAAIIACCAMFNHNKCLLTVLASVLCILIGMLLFGTVTIIRDGSMIDGTLRNATLDAMQNYTKSNETRDEVDWFQSQLHCCGSFNYSDWEDTPYYRDGKPPAYPASCCAKNCDGKPVVDYRDVFEHGCYELIHKALTTNTKYVAAGTAITLVLLVCGILATFALCFIRRRSGMDVPYANLTT